MAIPQRETIATTRSDLLVQVTDDGSRTLLRKGTADAFHSGCGAVSECRHVYLRNSGVIERLENGLPTRVLEIGLGTSMAMLMTVDIALKHKTPLTFVALENDWITVDVFQSLSPSDWCQDSDLVRGYQSFRQALADQVPPGTYDWTAGSEQFIQVVIGDAKEWSPGNIAPFDAIYFDPFCQESCPDLWTEEVFRMMRRLAAKGCRLTTYSCSRSVRGALESAGWSPNRVAGPIGGKREVLVAA